MRSLAPRRIRDWVCRTFLLVVAACGNDARLSDTDAALERLILSERFTAGRVAKSTPWNACQRDTSTLVLTTTCHPTGTTSAAADLRLVDATVSATLTGRTDATALRLRGLLALHDGVTQPDASARAVALLERAVSLAPTDAQLRNVLAVAHLAQAEREQRLAPLLDALEAVETSLDATPGDLAALYTKATILERLSLHDAAAHAWDAYLAVERDEDWIRDASERRAFLRTELTPGRNPRAAAASQSPGRVRDSLFAMLGRWGDAILHDDTATAHRELLSARTTLASAPATDASVSGMVRVAERPGRTREAQRALADGHVALANGFRAQAMANYNEAAALLTVAAHLLSANASPGAEWARVYGATTATFQGDYQQAATLLTTLTRTLDAQRSPALAGKVAWAEGVSWIRRGAYERADDEYRRAGPLFVSAGESENAGAVSYLRADGLLLGGRYADASEEILRGLHLLATRRDSQYLGLVLMKLCNASLAAGAPRTALTAASEVLSVVKDTRRPHLVAFAYLYGADALLTMRRTTPARTYLDSASAYVARMSPGDGRDRLAAEIAMRAAMSDLALRPDRESRVIDTAVTTFRRLGADGQLARAHHLAARAALARRDTAAADAALDAAADVVERQSATFTATAGAYMAETVENIYDDVARVALARADHGKAFRAIERGRLARWSHARNATATEVPAPDVVRKHLDAGTLVLSYALLPDRLVLWAIDRDSVAHFATAVSREAVAALIARIHGSRWTDSAAMMRLDTLLLAPISARLEHVERVVVIPDREITSVPFAALRHPVSRRNLVKDHEVRWLPSITQLVGTRPHSTTTPRASGSLLLTTAPQATAANDATLPPLTGAEREGASVADAYAARQWRVVRANDRPGLLAELGNASVFHFAGHAIENVDRPERSYLALNDSAQQRRAIEAADITTLRLDHVRLVVLSACRTLNARASRAGPVSGLAYSFLRSGAGGVVSSLWDIDDTESARVLTDFHSRLAAGATPAAALRSAQLLALQSPRAATRSPAVWAAFVYTGH